MNPAYSVILFTTATGAGYGLLALVGLTGVTHGPASSLAFGTVTVALALGLISLGLLSSTFHLGRPERAWRAFSQVKSSWLSREAAASVVTFAPAIPFAAAWSGIIKTPEIVGILGIATALMCLVTVYCTAKIYSTLRTVRAWYQPLTVPVYIAYALATGSILLMAISGLFGRFQIVLPLISVGALLLVAVLKFFYWRTIDREPKSHTIEDATGLGRAGRVSQWETPHTAKNFVMEEMGYAVARRHAMKLRSLVLFLIGVSLILVLLAIAMPVVGALAAVTSLAAALVERWLFFAEAQHVVTTYYGARHA